MKVLFIFGMCLLFRCRSGPNWNSKLIKRMRSATQLTAWSLTCYPSERHCHTSYSMYLINIFNILLLVSGLFVMVFFIEQIKCMDVAGSWYISGIWLGCVVWFESHLQFWMSFKLIGKIKLVKRNVIRWLIWTMNNKLYTIWMDWKGNWTHQKIHFKLWNMIVCD